MLSFLSTCMWADHKGTSTRWGIQAGIINVKQQSNFNTWRKNANQHTTLACVTIDHAFYFNFSYFSPEPKRKDSLSLSTVRVAIARNICHEPWIFFSLRCYFFFFTCIVNDSLLHFLFLPLFHSRHRPAVHPGWEALLRNCNTGFKEIRARFQGWRR